MATVTSRTVRVLGIPQEVKEGEFLAVARSLSSKDVGGWLSRVQTGDENPAISFATQYDGHVGTISLPSEKHKVKALDNHATYWRFDDKFNGVTVLVSPLQPDVDICAVHGLNGNAFQTWTAETNGKMWLRDLLPYSKPFNNARIMTFGYSSQISDRANISSISEWAHHLLESMAGVRRSQKEQERPIIFICHSLGGIVARQAMIRLNEYAHKQEYQGISLKSCGLLFLSTPHSGSNEADWNNFLLDIAQLSFGIRSEILNSLKSFNPFSAEGQEDFANMKHQPPFAAFYETQRTKIAKLHRHIVTRQSASLAGHIASPMLDVDHSTICKFDSKFSGFMQVVDKLRYLRDVLMDQETAILCPDPNNPWRAPPIALNCFQPEGKKFFEGRGLDQRSKMKGRHLELKSLKQIVEQLQETEKASIAITGIGGIGKTATLLEIAHQESEQRNIFFIHATDAASLHQSYLHIAKCIGPEYLLKEFLGRDIQAIWSSESEEDKVRRFKRWLNDPENIDSLFLLDDMDGIQELEDREAAFPDEAKIILYTTRNPIFHKNNIRRRQKLRLSTMNTEDIITLMEDIRNETPEYQNTADLHNKDILLGIVNAVQCHPLAALNAIKYIIRVLSQHKEATAGSGFVAMMAGNEHWARQHFLTYKPDSPSIMETFEVSRTRLSKPDTQALALMNFLSLIETKGKEDFDFRDFFFEHSCPIPSENFPDHQILGAENFRLQELFSELEKVSFGERLQTSKPFQFHPLWLECTRHTMGPEGLIRYARQILLVSYHTICVDHGVVNITPDIDDSFLRHVCKCLQVCGSFKIGLDDLELPAKVSKFFNVVQCAN